MSVQEHKKDAGVSLNVAVITVSDTRNEDTDRSGKLMKNILIEADHKPIMYKIVKDEKHHIKEAIQEASVHPEIDVILLNGGTGIAGRDVTVETVQELLTKEMPGFGELFRMLSYKEDIGTASILSRAIAGVTGGKVIFATPGSTGAVKLAMNRIIIPEMLHAVREVNKDKKRD